MFDVVLSPKSHDQVVIFSPAKNGAVLFVIGNELFRKHCSSGIVKSSNGPLTLVGCGRYRVSSQVPVTGPLIMTKSLNTPCVRGV